MRTENVIAASELPADVVNAIRAGRKIEAIKILREQTGMGLANAKVLVERAWRSHGPVKPVLSYADRPEGLSAFGKLLALVLVAIAAWYFLNGG